MRIKNTEDWEAFIFVCSEKSFVKASKRLDISPAVLTKRIARLESELGTRLLHRTTRSLSMTQEGIELLPIAQGLVEDMMGAEQLFEKQMGLSGLIRMTAPTTFCQRGLSSILAKFQNAYPQITLDLHLTNSNLNLIEERIDIAIRIGTLDDSSLVARKIGVNQLVVCASPKYLKKAPPLNEVSDLKSHPLLFLEGHKNMRFLKSGLRISDLAKASKIGCHDGGVLTALAVEGVGVTVRSDWDVNPLIQTGQLKQVLTQDPLQAAGDIFLVIPSKRHISPRVRELMNFISSNY